MGEKKAVVVISNKMLITLIQFHCFGAFRPFITIVINYKWEWSLCFL